MHKTISTLAMALLVSATYLHGQTRGPSPLFNSLPTAADSAVVDTLYVDPPEFLIGWNWGPALRRVNVDLKTNIWHCSYPFRWGPPADMRQTNPLHSMPPASRLIMAPSWNVPTVRFFVPDHDTARIVWFARLVQLDTAADRPPLSLNLGQPAVADLNDAMGMRFHPELVMGDTLSFTPRTDDQQGAVFGFRTRDTTIGSVPTTSAEPNYHRYLLDTTGVTGWTTVLDESWPERRFGEWTTAREYEQMRAFNGHMMYVAVNLRRTDATDTAMDATPLLRLTVNYRRCGV